MRLRWNGSEEDLYFGLELSDGIEAAFIFPSRQKGRWLLAMKLPGIMPPRVSEGSPRGSVEELQRVAETLTRQWFQKVLSQQEFL